MAGTVKLLLVAGARPNFMKIAPLIKAIKEHNATQNGITFQFRLVHTGQHYDEKMSDVFFSELGIPAPDVNLGVGSGSHAAQTASVMLKFEPVLDAERPDWVVVVGDVNSTLACTLVASKKGVKVAHVEAGLRSYDRTMPEEINRVLTDSIADLLLTPSLDADENLKKEGIPASRIRLVGNIMIDALVSNLEQARKSSILADLGLKSKRFAYVTLHRPSNVDDPASLAKIIEVLIACSKKMPVVFPVHPRTRKMITNFGIALKANESFKVLDPIGYHESICLTENARLVLTDSGGLQEESTFFRTPCLTLRPNTERPITITSGSNRLTTHVRLWNDILELLGEAERLGTVPELWDGKASERTLASLNDHVR